MTDSTTRLRQFECIDAVKRGGRLIALCAAMALLIAFASFQIQVARAQEADETPSTRVESDDAPANVTQTIDDRLTSLDPDQPNDYFLLGEDAADVGRTELAQRLFVIAAHLDPDAYGRSSCLALAELADEAGKHDRARQLRALARMYATDSSYTSVRLDEGATPEDEYRRAGSFLAAFLGFYRSGYGTRAIKALDEDKTSYQLLSEYEGAIGQVSEILSFCRNNVRCEICENHLIVETSKLGQNAPRTDRRPGESRFENDFVVCPRLDSYRPKLSRDRLVGMLEVESALSGGTSASWGAQLRLDSGAPRPVLDPSFLGRMLGIDASLVYFRNGTWVAKASE